MTGIVSAKALLFAAPHLYVEPQVLVQLKLQSVRFMVRRREESS